MPLRQSKGGDMKEDEIGQRGETGRGDNERLEGGRIECNEGSVR